MTSKESIESRINIHSKETVPTFRLWFKLLLSYLFPTAAIVIGMGLVAYFASRSAMEHELGNTLMAIARIGANSMSRPRAIALSPGDETTRTYANLLAKLANLKQATKARRVVLFDSRERCIIDSEQEYSIGETIPSLAANRAELQEVFNGEGRASVLFNDDNGNKYKTGFAPVIVGGKVQAALGVDGSASFFGPLEQLRSSLFFIGSVALMLVILVTLLVSRTITRPLNKLAQAARAIEQGELESKISINTNDEISFLADTLNDMRKAIKNRDQQMQMMLSGIAHEVRNPLGGMTLFVGLLKEEIKQEKPMDHINRISSELEYLSRVVTDFLDFARHKSPQITKADPELELEQVRTICLADAEKKNVKLQLNIDRDVKSVMWDTQGMRRAVINLVKNSIQACSDGGQVNIHMETDDDKIYLSVSDNGCGIAEDEKENIFKPFFTTRQKGTGLGLALVKKTVEEHNGAIELLSKHETPTIFRITLPREPAQ